VQEGVSGLKIILCFILGHKKFGKTVIGGNFICDRCGKRVVKLINK
jgi:hypothetical protein